MFGLVFGLFVGGCNALLVWDGVVVCLTLVVVFVLCLLWFGILWLCVFDWQCRVLR